jgi:DNA topoisomerase-2
MLALLGKPADASLPAGPLQPWFNGFTGRIQATSTPGTLHTFGVVQRLSSSELRVVELPVGKWTDDYKSFLVDAMQKDKAGSWLAGFKEYHTVSNVDFVLKLSPAGRDALCADSIDHEELVSKLKLRGSLSLGNMHVFDASGRIKRYESAEDIIAAHMPIREALYTKRKNAGVQALQHRVSLLENRARFVAGVIAGDIAITKSSKAQLEATLAQQGFRPLSARADVAPSFEYLTSLSLASLTTDAVERAVADVAVTRAELSVLQATPVSEVWASELLAFRTQVLSTLANTASSVAPQATRKKRATSRV